MNIEELNKKIVKLAKTRKGAIEGSILKWEYLVKANRETVFQSGMSGGYIECGLCIYYDYPACQMCLLLEINQKCNCPETAYYVANTYRKFFVTDPTLANFHKWRKAAREMLRVLRTL